MREILISGDKKHRSDFLCLLQQFGMKIYVYDPTRITFRTKSCFDNVITNYNFSSQTIVNIDSGLSDHRTLLVPVDYKSGKNESKHLAYISKRQIKSDTVSLFISLLRIELNDFSLKTSAKQSFDCFLKSFLVSLGSCFPWKFIKPRSKTGKINWIAKGIKVTLELNKELYKLSKIRNDLQFKTYYSTYRQYCRD